MKIVKILLALSAATFINLAQAADRFSMGDVWVKETGSSTINYRRCQKVDDIRIKTEKEIWLSKVVVEFESGMARTFNIQTNLEQNGKSDWLDPGTKCIDSITIYADIKKSKTHLEIEGRIK